MKKLNISNSTQKIFLIAILILLFLVPVSLIKNLVGDRNRYQQEAIRSITEPLGGQAEIQGLVVAIPYKKYRDVYDTKGNKHTEFDIEHVIFAPDLLDMDITVKPYYLSRGIFKVPVFNGQIELKADFSDFDFSYFNISEADVIKKDAVLILGFSNTKNLTKQPNLKMNGEQLQVSPIKYDSISPFMTSVCYPLTLSKTAGTNGAASNSASPFVLSGSIDFQGGQNIKLRPIAQENIFNMKSDWKSPSFSGGWLPTERELSDNGFTATWNIAGLSTVYPKSWLAKTEYYADSVDISFMIPVDSYKKTERSVKYALLFLLIPFLALLISEIFSKTRIHPVQYCLIGLADVIFYLLLLSISEHISFDLAYLICSITVCVATLLYSMAIFKNKKWGLLLSGVQLVSYVFLYGTLQAEDYALLIGSIGLFAVIALLMFITRKIDWYSLNGEENKNVTIIN
jgi:inner membrane protein